MKTALSLGTMAPMTLDVVSGMDIHAAAYARQSLARENKSEVSTETQTEACVSEGQRRGAAHIEKYVDLGKSAYKADVVRKDFDRMIADCRAGRINMIIVYYVSRFSRMEPLDAIPIVTELLNLGVTIVSVTEGEFRKGNLMDLIHLIMRLDAAHNESKNKSAAVTSAKQAAKALGGYVGGLPPYGFRFQPETRHNAAGRPVVVQKLVKNEAEADVIRRAWRMIKENMGKPYFGVGAHPGSLGGVCIALMKDNVPTSGQGRGRNVGKKGVWTVQALRRILRDPRLAGFEAEAVYGERPDGARTRTAHDYRIVRNPETLDPVVFDSEPIISAAEWYQLQAWLDGRGPGKGLSRGRALLSGLHDATGEAILRCECGRPLAAMGTPGVRSGSAYRCTRPRGAQQAGQHPGTNSIAQAPVDELVARRIFALIAAAEGDMDDDTAEILAAVTKRFARGIEAPETAGERSAILADRADAVDALNGVADGLAAARSDIVRRRLLEQEAIAAERLEKIDARLLELDALSSPVLPLREWLAEGNDSDPMGEGSWWHSASLDERREMVSWFISRITVAKATERNGYGRYWSPADTYSRVTITWATSES